MQSHTKRVYNILLDGKAYRSDEIARIMFGSDETTRTGFFHLPARIYDIRNGIGVKKMEITSWQDKGDRKFCWYQIEKDWRKELVKACLKGNKEIKTAEEILNHITCRTGIVSYKKPEDITQEKAKWLLSEFEIDKPCCPA